LVAANRRPVQCGEKKFALLCQRLMPAQNLAPALVAQSKNANAKPARRDALLVAAVMIFVAPAQEGRSSSH
jgi:hypothetical protein